MLSLVETSGNSIPRKVVSWETFRSNSLPIPGNIGRRQVLHMVKRCCGPVLNVVCKGSRSWTNASAAQTSGSGSCRRNSEKAGSRKIITISYTANQRPYLVAGCVELCNARILLASNWSQKTRRGHEEDNAKQKGKIKIFPRERERERDEKDTLARGDSERV